jgi:hypothetical protein
MIKGAITPTKEYNKVDISFRAIAKFPPRYQLRQIYGGTIVNTSISLGSNLKSYSASANL